jgi:hypothetical protein
MATETILWRGVIAVVLVAYAICFGKIAARLGRNPFVYGLLVLIPGVNLLAMAWLAFSQPPQRIP